MIYRKNGALPVVTAVEKTACTALEEATMPKSAHVDSKRRLKGSNPSLIGLLLILLSSEAVAIKNTNVNGDWDEWKNAERSGKWIRNVRRRNLPLRLHRRLPFPGESATGYPPSLPCDGNFLKLCTALSSIHFKFQIEMSRSNQGTLIERKLTRRVKSLVGLEMMRSITRRLKRK